MSSSKKLILLEDIKKQEKKKESFVFFLTAYFPIFQKHIMVFKTLRLTCIKSSTLHANYVVWGFFLLFVVSYWSWIFFLFGKKKKSKQLKTKREGKKRGKI